jgi:hypothetical protein
MPSVISSLPGASPGMFGEWARNPSKRWQPALKPMDARVKPAAARFNVDPASHLRRFRLAPFWCFVDIGGNWMFRITAFVLAILAVGSIAASSIAQAQKASDPKSQPGSGQCRLSNGQRC